MLHLYSFLMVYKNLGCSSLEQGLSTIKEGWSADCLLSSQTRQLHQ